MGYLEVVDVLGKTVKVAVEVLPVRVDVSCQTLLLKPFLVGYSLSIRSQIRLLMPYIVLDWNFLDGRTDEKPFDVEVTKILVDVFGLSIIRVVRFCHLPSPLKIFSCTFVFNTESGIIVHLL